MAIQRGERGRNGNPNIKMVARDELNPPGCAKGGGAFDKGTSVAADIHYKDSSLSSKLLNDDNPSMLLVLCNFGEINWDLRRGGADTYAILMILPAINCPNPL